MTIVGLYIMFGLNSINEELQEPWSPRCSLHL